MNMKDLNEIEDITTLRTDKYGLITFLKDRQVVLDMVENGLINKDSLVNDLSQWMDDDTIVRFLNKNKKFNFEFQL